MQRLFFSNFDVGQKMKSVGFWVLQGVLCKLAANGSGIAAVGELEALTFNTAQMYKKGLNVEYSTSAPIAAIPC